VEAHPGSGSRIGILCSIVVPDAGAVRGQVQAAAVIALSSLRLELELDDAACGCDGVVDAHETSDDVRLEVDDGSSHAGVVSWIIIVGSCSAAV